MTDDHSQQAEQEEHRHQDEGHVVWLGFKGSLFPGPRRLTSWGSQRGDKKVNYFQKLKWMSSQCPPGQGDTHTGYKDAAETQMKQLWGLKCHQHAVFLFLDQSRSARADAHWLSRLATEVERRVNAKHREPIEIDKACWLYKNKENIKSVKDMILFLKCRI